MGSFEATSGSNRQTVVTVFVGRGLAFQMFTA